MDQTPAQDTTHRATHRAAAAAALLLPLLAACSSTPEPASSTSTVTETATATATATAEPSSATPPDDTSLTLNGVDCTDPTTTQQARYEAGCLELRKDPRLIEFDCTEPDVLNYADYLYCGTEQPEPDVDTDAPTAAPPADDPDWVQKGYDGATDEDDSLWTDTGPLTDPGWDGITNPVTIASKIPDCQPEADGSPTQVTAGPDGFPQAHCWLSNTQVTITTYPGSPASSGATTSDITGATYVRGPNFIATLGGQFDVGASPDEGQTVATATGGTLIP